MTRVFLDLETIPSQRPDILAEIAAEALAHNTSLKKPHPPEAIKEIVDEAHRKTALDGSAGEIVCIGVAIDNGPTQSWHRDFRVAGSEADLLTRFRNDMSDALDGRGGVVVGHNAVAFDRPFLRQRAVVCGVALPSWMMATIKPWEATDLDTMLKWTGGSPGKTISLARLARALNVGSKTEGLDGSNIWDAVLAGRIADVARYCENDVSLTRACFHRMTMVSAEACQ